MVKRIVTAIFLAVVFGLGVFPQTAFAATTYTFDFITYDNGMNGKWAVDYFHSQVVIEPQGGNLYKVTFLDGGSFVTLAAKSPGGDGTTTVAAGVKGTISGGDVLMVNGVLKGSIPAHISTIDYRSWAKPNYLSPFFDSVVSKTYLSWGWSYKSCGNGTWNDNEGSEAAYSSSGPNPLMGDVQGEIADCQKEKAGPTWFNPNDNRVEGKPGDRLVVWVNPQPNGDWMIVVYGVNPEGFGFLLTTFSEKQVRAAGANGVFHDLGDLGVVSISEATPENFWLAWNGGPYNANGQGLWAKGFHYSLTR